MSGFTSSAAAMEAAAAAESEAGAGAYEEMLRVVEACAMRIRWRLRPGSKRRLLNGANSSTRPLHDPPWFKALS